jgi:uncharacterized phage infection (PIP) family protein YhgE
MIRSWVGWAAAGLAVMGIARAADGPAAKTSPEELLKGLGLHRAHAVYYVLDAEAEVKKKLGVARSLLERWNSVRSQQAALQEVGGQIQALTEQSNQLRQAINSSNMQMNNYRMSYGGRGFRGYNPMLAQRNQYTMTLNAVNQQLNLLKSQAPTPQRSKELDAEAQRQRDAFVSAVHDLRELVDSTVQKYDELAKNDQAKAALATLGQTAHVALKLGPSREFLDAVKQLERAEKSLKGPTGEPPAHRGRTTKRAKKAKAAPH